MSKKSEQSHPKFDFDLSRTGRGTFNKNQFEFDRGDEPYRGSSGQLRLRSRKGGDQVIVKLYSDTDADGRFSKDELIFRGVAADDGIYDRLNGSSGKIRWDYNDCTPCLREPFNFLTLNPIGSKKIEFFNIGFMGNLNSAVRGDSIESRPCTMQPISDVTELL